MATQALTNEQLMADLKALEGFGGNITRAAKALNLPRGTFQHRLRVARERGLIVEEDDNGELPSYAEVMSRIKGTNPQHVSRFWRDKTVRRRVPDAPFGIWFMGDPHMDAPGFDVDRFQADMTFVRMAQAEHTVLAVNMGDILDHWPSGGKLAKKLGDSSVDRLAALALVRGLLKEEGIDWCLHILGNHDVWPGHDFATLMRQWTDAPVIDWRARLEIAAGDFNFTAVVGHDLAGSSIYNPLHGPMRRGRDEGTADLYVAAHRHHAAQGKAEDALRGRVYNYLRVGSYKRADEHSYRLGHAEQEEGASALAVINPKSRSMDGVCRTFLDLDEGGDYLAFLKARA